MHLKFRATCHRKGFLHKQNLLDAYGYCMQENTIDFFCLVKDELLRIGGVTKFNITADLILEVKRHITA